MNMLKASLVASLTLLGTQAVFAQETVVENYEYGNHLDIAKVISQEPIPDVCGVVPVKMRYLDHEGHEHLMQYLVQGNGCNNN
jgi:hypothetical protein